MTLYMHSGFAPERESLVVLFNNFPTLELLGRRCILEVTLQVKRTALFNADVYTCLEIG